VQAAIILKIPAGQYLTNMVFLNKSLNYLQKQRLQRNILNQLENAQFSPPVIPAKAGMTGGDGNDVSGKNGIPKSLQLRSSKEHEYILKFLQKIHPLTP